MHAVLRGAVLVLLLVGWASQAPPPRYTAGILATASFDLRTRAEVRTQAGGAARTEVVGREARIEVRGHVADQDLQVEAWFDSLRIWREGPEGRLSPDGDAVVGGRFRGVLTPAGRLTVRTRPFIPDELTEVTDLGGAMDDFLPRLPGVALVVGGVWEDGPFRIVRRPDSTSGSARLHRYRWSRVEADTVEQLTDDSLQYVVRSRLDEEGDLVWHATLGPLVWHRRATITMEIPADGPVRRPARTRMTEETWVWRRRIA